MPWPAWPSTPPWLGALAAAVVVCCLLRLALEVVGHPHGVLELLAPMSFLVLVAVLTVLGFRGFPGARPPV